MAEVAPIDHIRTSRLRLRTWREADKTPFAALNADPEVTAYLSAVRGRSESDAFVERIMAAHARDGYGLWAVEVAAESEFVGFVGFLHVDPSLPCAPAVEIGWRLARRAWGHGYATEAARACLDAGFDRIGLDAVVSLTTPDNLRSQAVMRRLGMTRDPGEDFDHPRARGGRAVVFRLSAADWRRTRGGRDASQPG